MSNPIRIEGFDHIVLRVADKAGMLAFYVEVLGLSVDRDRPELGLTHIRAGRQMIDLVTLDGPLGRMGGAGPGPEGRNLDHFALQVRPFDADAIRGHLAAQGVAVVEEGRRLALMARVSRSMCGIPRATRSSSRGRQSRAPG